MWDCSIFHLWFPFFKNSTDLLHIDKITSWLCIIFQFLYCGISSNEHQTQSLKKLVGYVISDHLKARIYCEWTIWSPIKNFFTPCCRMSDKASADVLLRFPFRRASHATERQAGCLVSTLAAVLCGSPWLEWKLCSMTFHQYKEGRLRGFNS